MPMPVALSDEEMAAVMRAAAPLDSRHRDRFLQELAVELANCREIGPGAVFRAIREVQRRHFDPPTFENGRLTGTGKHGR